MCCGQKIMEFKHFLQKSQGWVITAASYFIFFMGYGILYSYGLLYVELQSEFKSSNASTAWIGSLGIAMSCFGTFLSSRLLSRFSNRLIAAVGVFLVSIGCISTSFLPCFLPIYFCYAVLIGIGVNFLVVSSMNLITKYFPEKNAARSTTFSTSGSTSGMLALNPVVYILITNWGWRWMLRALGGVNLIIGLLCVAAYAQPSRTHIVASGDDTSKPKYAHLHGEDKEKEAETKEFLEKSQKDDSAEEVDRRMSDQFKTLLFPELWLFVIAFIGTSTGQGFYYISFVGFMTANGFEKGTAALVMTTIAVAELFGKLSLSAIGDNLPFPRIYVFHIASVMGIGVMATLFVANQVWIMYCLAVVTGLLMSPFDSMLYSIGVDIFGPERNHETATVLLIANGIGFTLGSLFGMSVDRYGSYDVAIFSVMAMYCVTIVLYTGVPLFQKFFAKDRYIMVNRKDRQKMETEGGTTESESQTLKQYSHEVATML